MEFTDYRLSLCESFTREACNDLARPVKVDALGVLIEAFLHMLPRFTAKHERAKMHVSVSS